MGRTRKLNGNLGYSSDGVRLEVAESLTDIQTDGVTMAVDTRRTEESILLSATLMEDSLDLAAFNMYPNGAQLQRRRHSSPPSTTVQGGYSCD